MNQLDQVPEGLVSGIGEPDRSTIIMLWTTANRCERHGRRDRAQACWRRIVEIKNPYRAAAGTAPF